MIISMVGTLSGFRFLLTNLCKTGTIRIDYLPERSVFVKIPRLDYRALALAALAALALSLLPLFCIAPYNHPCTDDYNYGAYAAQAVREGSPLAALPAALRKTAETYQNWQGTFSAIFLMSLHPAVFGEGFYALTPFLMLEALGLSTFFFLWVCLGKLGGGARHVWVLAGCGVLFFSVQRAPSAFEGFFWYNGALFYTFFYALSLCLYGLALLLLRAERLRWGLLVPAALLAFFLGGGNYSTALLTLVLLACGAGWAFLRQRPWPVRLGMLSLLALEGSALLISAAAPGNAVRQGLLPNQPGPLEAVGKALLAAARLALESVDLPFLLMLLALAPVLWGCARRAEFSFPCPALAPLAAVCLTGVEMTPPLYAMGHTGAQRMQDLYYFTFCLLAVGVEFYLLGWLARRVEPKAPATLWPGASLGTALLLCLCLLCGPELRQLSGASALLSLRGGEAQAYHQQMEARTALYRDPAVRRVEAAPLTAFPPVLRPSGVPDLTEDPEATANRYAAAFYGKEQVVLKP